MILIALGSNVGGRAALLAQALAAIEAAGIAVLAQSALHETPALLPEGAAPEWDMPYLNQVVAVETEMDAPALLAALKTIEQQLGRQDRGRWGPREIDLDLLAYEQAQLHGAELTLPHPQLQARRFVLSPLVEIAPDWVHPTLHKTARQLLAELPA